MKLDLPNCSLEEGEKQDNSHTLNTIPGASVLMTDLSMNFILRLVSMHSTSAVGVPMPTLSGQSDTGYATMQLGDCCSEQKSCSIQYYTKDPVSSHVPVNH